MLGQNWHPASEILCSTTSASTRASRFRCGGLRAGSMTMILAVGSSGIAGTISVDGSPAKMRDKSVGGRQCADTSRRSFTTVSLEMCGADGASARRCFIGHTTARRFDLVGAGHGRIALGIAEGISPLSEGIPEYSQKAARFLGVWGAAAASGKRGSDYIGQHGRRRRFSEHTQARILGSQLGS